jgi:hypothetical protein
MRNRSESFFFLKSHRYTSNFGFFFLKCGWFSFLNKVWLGLSEAMEHGGLVVHWIRTWTTSFRILIITGRVRGTSSWYLSGIGAPLNFPSQWKVGAATLTMHRYPQKHAYQSRAVSIVQSTFLALTGSSDGVYSFFYLWPSAPSSSSEYQLITSSL